MQQQTTCVLASFLASSFGVGALLFRRETLKRDVPVSGPVRWRFRLATAASILFAMPLVALGVPDFGNLFALVFLVWPVIALWLIAAPLVYRRPSGYVLSVAAILSIVFWYAFWGSSGL